MLIRSCEELCLVIARQTFQQSLGAQGTNIDHNLVGRGCRMWKRAAGND